MIRETRFVQSHAPYAVNLASLRADDSGVSYHVDIDAAWFRRRQGTTVAVWGQLWDYRNPPPADALDFLAGHRDGRYGGRARARWDGHTLWTDGLSYDAGVDLLNRLLRPMLANHPAVPDGYDGWWTFREPR